MLHDPVQNFPVLCLTIRGIKAQLNQLGLCVVRQHIVQPQHHKHGRHTGSLVAIHKSMVAYQRKC